MSSGVDGRRRLAPLAQRVRPAVDVVVPFAGSVADLDAVCDRLAALNLGPDDSLLVVDNTPGGGDRAALAASDIDVRPASGMQTPGFARNFGASEGDADWVVFIDADTIPDPELLDRFFDPLPAPRTALIGGGVLDEEVPPDAPPAARYAYLRGLMSQAQTLELGRWGFPKSVNVACRRTAFEAVGGFREDIRAGEDADLTYRLRVAGWEVERREGAAVVHLSRRTLGGLIKQQVLWGAGAGWLSRTHPGSMPLIRRPESVWHVLGEPLKQLLSTGLRDRDAAIYAALRPTEAITRRIGRLRSNTQSGQVRATGLASGLRVTGAPRTPAAVVVPARGSLDGAQITIDALERQTVRPAQTVLVDPLAGSTRGRDGGPLIVATLADALASAVELGDSWLWLLNAGVAPEPTALESLLGAAAGTDPAPVLLASKVLTPDGRLDESVAPVPESHLRADRVLAPLHRRCLALRVARSGSLLVHGPALGRLGVTSTRSLVDRDLEWTARLLREGTGVLVPESVAISYTDGPRLPVRLACSRIAASIRMLSALEQEDDRVWFAVHLAERGLESVRGSIRLRRRRSGQLV